MSKGKDCNLKGVAGFHYSEIFSKYISLQAVDFSNVKKFISFIRNINLKKKKKMFIFNFPKVSDQGHACLVSNTLPGQKSIVIPEGLLY